MGAPNPWALCWCSSQPHEVMRSAGRGRLMESLCLSTPWVLCCCSQEKRVALGWLVVGRCSLRLCTLSAFLEGARVFAAALGLPNNQARGK